MFYLEMFLLFISMNKMELFNFDLMWYVIMYLKYVYCIVVFVFIEYLKKRDKI